MIPHLSMLAGPLPLTVGHFWLVVWQQRSRAVLMLNRVFERGQPKCAQYWPAAQGEAMTFEDVGLKVEHVRSAKDHSATLYLHRFSFLVNPRILA